jgi:hypothetical protein
MRAVTGSVTTSRRGSQLTTLQSRSTLLENCPSWPSAPNNCELVGSPVRIACTAAAVSGGIPKRGSKLGKLARRRNFAVSALLTKTCVC